MRKSSFAADREFDVVVFGASGFTGRLVCEHLARRCPLSSSKRWAAAGRNRGKIERALFEVGLAPDIVPILVADSRDREALEAIASRTRVVASTAGPYATLGSTLVEVCVALGTDYCDLAGEVQWMRRMIDRFQARAEATGARIVHACGFDSIPSDLGVWLLQQYARRRYGRPCREVALLVQAMRGGASGGTIASLLNLVDEAGSDRRVRDLLHDPYALNPPDRRGGADEPDQTLMEYDHAAGVWTAPFVMERVNTRIVRRTNALLDYPYGEDFSYREAWAGGRGVRGLIRSTAVTTAVCGVELLSRFALPRNTVLRPLLPRPGEGPGRRTREQGYFDLLLVGRTPAGEEVRMDIAGEGDPGYGSTSKMFAESALCLARDDLDRAGGFWTPASALGSALAHRLLPHAGVHFEPH